MYPETSGNYVQVQNQNQMTKVECETQLFLLSDNKNFNLPFGRSNKWEVVGGQPILKDGKIIISDIDTNEAEISFFYVPTGWETEN